MEVVRVAAFVGPGLRGNPAGVVLGDEELPAARRQELASAIDLPATAFPVPRAGGGFDLRWHGPTEELAFCGHGTLAAAHVLWDRGRALPEEVAFATPAGELRARPAGEAVELDLPALPLADEPVPDGLVEALGVEALTVARGALDALVEVATPEAVIAARPDLRALAALPVRGALLTAAGGPDGADVTSRCFFPAVGIDEDPATGSAHCLLGPWWASRLGRDELRARQASERGGALTLRVRGERVLLAGLVGEEP
jgi:PhzF family phenazine biosynthesis protein